MTIFFSTPSPRYFAPASYKQHKADGSLETIEFDCEFKRLKRSEQDALDREVKTWRTKGNPADLDARLLARVCTAWRVKVPKDGPDGAEDVKVIPFAEATAIEMEETHPGFMASCARAFFISSQPSASAHLAEKNS